jgi:glycosyltransferase involved in cell wall biosynthesis
LRFIFEHPSRAQTAQDNEALLPQRLTPEQLALSLPTCNSKNAYETSSKNLAKAISYHLFHGFVPDVRRILRSIDALVMPSLWKACPLQPIEAFIDSCPVIASDCIGHREVTPGTQALTVRMKDAKSLADAMRDFMVIRRQ